ncbi:MAG: hypothetical protein ACI89Z_000280 [Porticoccus sp.]|jgi:hypothetical protein
MELARRHLEGPLHREHVFTSPSLVGEFLLEQLRHCQQKVSVVLFFDARHRLVAWQKLFFGTVDGASVHPREVVKRALHHNAAAVIFFSQSDLWRGRAERVRLVDYPAIKGCWTMLLWVAVIRSPGLSKVSCKISV